MLIFYSKLPIRNTKYHHVQFLNIIFRMYKDLRNDVRNKINMNIDGN